MVIRFDAIPVVRVYELQPAAQGIRELTTCIAQEFQAAVPVDVVAWNVHELHQVREVLRTDSEPMLPRLHVRKGPLFG